MNRRSLLAAFASVPFIAGSMRKAAPAAPVAEEIKPLLTSDAYLGRVTAGVIHSSRGDMVIDIENATLTINQGRRNIGLKDIS